MTLGIPWLSETVAHSSSRQASPFLNGLRSFHHRIDHVWRMRSLTRPFENMNRDIKSFRRSWSFISLRLGFIGFLARRHTFADLCQKAIECRPRLTLKCFFRTYRTMRCSRRIYGTIRFCCALPKTNVFYIAKALLQTVESRPRFHPVALYLHHETTVYHSIFRLMNFLDHG
jgi:hypothetical protein